MRDGDMVSAHVSTGPTALRIRGALQKSPRDHPIMPAIVRPSELRPPGPVRVRNPATCPASAPRPPAAAASAGAGEAMLSPQALTLPLSPWLSPGLARGMRQPYAMLCYAAVDRAIQPRWSVTPPRRSREPDEHEPIVAVGAGIVGAGVVAAGAATGAVALS